MSEKSVESSASEKPGGRPAIAKPSGIKPPSASTSSQPSKISRMCSHGHEKKPDLPDAATPRKTSESHKSI